jgi:hypothetical protein
MVFMRIWIQLLTSMCDYKGKRSQSSTKINKILNSLSFILDTMIWYHLTLLSL